MTTVSKYQVYCTTENKYYTLWNDSLPTVCPNNSAHSISSVSVIDIISDQDVKIIEENPPIDAPSTGGHYAATTIVLDIPAATIAGEVTTTTKCFHYPIGLMAVHFTSTTDMEGDVLNADMALDTIVGIITEDVDIGATCVDIGISVSSTVIDHMEVGYHVRLFDGVNQDDVDKCYSIDTENQIIKVNKETTHAFSAASPTYVQMTIEMLQDFVIGPAQTYQLGLNSSGSSYVPADTIGSFRYENWEMSAKRLYLFLEYFY